MTLPTDCIALMYEFGCCGFMKWRDEWSWGSPFDAVKSIPTCHMQNIYKTTAVLWQHYVICKAPFTRYNLLSNQFDNRVNVCIHDTTGCQTRCQTGLTIGCIVYIAGCQTGCTTQFDNRLNEQWLFVQHGWTNSGCSFNTDVKPVVNPGCTTGLTTGCLFTLYRRLSIRLYNRLYRVNGA